MIQLFKPSITEEEIQAVAEVLRSGWLGLGPKTAEFERGFAAAFSAPHAVALNSGTAALHLALKVLGIGPGDEVLVPALTFASTAEVVLYVGATPVFVDVEPVTLNISVVDLERKVTERTRAAIVVHYGGHPCELDEIGELARRRGFAVVEDAAHACGATYRDRPIGSISSLTCFSFHAVKNLTTGEGGMVTTANEEFDKRLRRLRWMGISKDTWGRTEKNEVYAWRYTVEEVGYKCHMSDIAAALGLVQLRRLGDLNAKRRSLVERYKEHFSDLGWLELPTERDHVRSSWHIFRVALEPRDALIGFLKSKGIAPGVHYYPLHYYPCFRQAQVPLPVTESAWKRSISLPLYPDLCENDQDTVIEAVRQFGRELGL
ncbi:MAG: DegT/DnrJ/EryC1/StrS family aminotransferase [Chloroflexi bacterium]|nr:DegT/DnrJ/EryC1/StrS family aminotransferase [Chloroflexota bacterium]MCL5108114.1 DegT/DnrJ/EryC1/StrS family aminotransferase [Chloroflexota bacterium]